MSVFKTEGVVLRVGKLSEKELFYRIIFRDYGILTVKKKKKAREKPVDIGYHINCEIITHKEKSIHTIGNIKILTFFGGEEKKYSEIESFLKLLSLIVKELPIGSPHYEVYDLLTLLIASQNTVNSQKFLLSHLKLIQCFGNLPETHTDITAQKILKFIHSHSHSDIMRLGQIPEKTIKKLEKII